MSAAEPTVRDSIVDKLRTLKDQLDLMQQVRDVVFDTRAQAAFPAAAVREVRRLFEEFDAKHPPQPKPAPKAVER